MNEHPVDSEGNPISVGSNVAYNKSGRVVRGRVISFKPRTDRISTRSRAFPYGACLQWIVEIDYGGEKPSIVKDTDGILVI